MRGMKRAQSELRTLIADGWILIAEADVNQSHYFTLRHARNKSRMRIQVHPNSLEYLRDNVLVKAEIYV